MASAFFRGQPVRLSGLSSQLYNGRGGLVCEVAQSGVRVGVLLWDEAHPKSFHARNIVPIMNPHDHVQNQCFECQSQIDLSVRPSCLCPLTSKRGRLFAEFGAMIQLHCRRRLAGFADGDADGGNGEVAADEVDTDASGLRLPRYAP